MVLFVCFNREGKKERTKDKEKKEIHFIQVQCPKKHINKAREHFLLDPNEPNISYKNPKKPKMKVKGP